MTRYILLFAAGAMLAIAQQKPDMPLPQELADYLQFSPDQQAQVAKANGAFTQLTSDKLARSAQVQAEIAQETQKATLDPMALGVRYAELEAIRREITAEQKKIRAQVENVLTPAQKAKLQTLQEALRLSAIGCQAVALNLMDQVQSMGAGCIGSSDSTMFVPPVGTAQPPKP